MKKTIAITASLIALLLPHYSSAAPRQTPAAISEMEKEYASFYRVDPSLLDRVISCESGGNQDAVGDRGTSYGLVQIHLPSHPDVTEEQALDPAFSINFLASGISSGRGRMWTCYRGISTRYPLPRFTQISDAV